jgi:hypothetical protein
MKALGRGSLASYIKVGLDIAGALFWAAALVIGLAMIVYGAVIFAIHVGLLAATIFSGGAADHQGHVRYDLQLDPWQVAFPGLLAAAIAVGGGLIVVRRLKALFASFSSGDPFNRENAAHLRAIWITLAGIELGRYAVAAAAGLLLMMFGQPSGAELKIGVKFDPMPWFTIAVLFVLAEVFREGARLKEEQELTI